MFSPSTFLKKEKEKNKKKPLNSKDQTAMAEAKKLTRSVRALPAPPTRPSLAGHEALVNQVN